MPSDKKPCSNIPPIAKVESLASMLPIQKDNLIEISNSIDTLWKPGKLLRKKNGDPRPTLDAKPPLKILHEKIKNRILKKAYYPPYLLGGIADSMTPRDYKRHATIHCGKRILISEDVKNFFPSSSYDVVIGIWKYIFLCTPDMAKLLANITTLNGSLPQGWKTSGYLANLAFWDLEAELVEKLAKRGFAYSRFIDDITISCKFRINESHKTFVISEIYRMLFAKGYAPKRSKHQILASNKKIEVTGLIVNSKRPTLPSKNEIRAAVHKCEHQAKKDRTSSEYHRLWNSVSGKVGTLTRFHPNKGKTLRNRLRAIKPL